MRIHEPEHPADCRLPVRQNCLCEQFTNQRIKSGLVPLRIGAACIQGFLVEGKGDVFHEFHREPAHGLRGHSHACVGIKLTFTRSMQEITETIVNND